MSKKEKKPTDSTKAFNTKEEKIAHLKAEIQKAEEEGDYGYVAYLMEIQELTINVYEGGKVIFQSGKPTPPY